MSKKAAFDKFMNYVIVDEKLRLFMEQFYESDLMYLIRPPMTIELVYSKKKIPMVKITDGISSFVVSPEMLGYYEYEEIKKAFRRYGPVDQYTKEDYTDYYDPNDCDPPEE